MQFKLLRNYSIFLVTSILLLNCDTDKETKTIETQKTTKVNGSDTLIFAELLTRDTKLSGDEFKKIQSKFRSSRNKFNKDNKDFASLLKVVEVYVYEARVTGEHPHYYSAALNTLNWMLNKDSSLTKDQKFSALFYKATVLLSQHKFNEALKTGEEALKLNNFNSGIYGVLVDANVEIGNYDEAVKMADKMIEIRPDLRSYSRISYLREIYGDIVGAKKAMISAVKTGDPISEYTCWGLKTLGEIYESEGKLDSAATSYEITLERRANYPFGIAGLGRIEAKKGNTEKALELYKEALEILPEIGFNIDVANLKMKQGKLENKEATINKIETMFKEDIESGHNMDLEYANFLYTFKNDYDGALELALKEHKNRTNNIDVNKTLAFIYFGKQDLENAAKHLKVAMTTGKQDAELFYMKGLIEKDNALIEKSLAINPYQSHKFLRGKN